MMVNESMTSFGVSVSLKVLRQDGRGATTNNVGTQLKNGLGLIIISGVFGLIYNDYFFIIINWS